MDLILGGAEHWWWRKGNMLCGGVEADLRHRGARGRRRRRLDDHRPLRCLGRRWQGPGADTALPRFAHGMA